jgi:hypothetical protein
LEHYKISKKTNSSSVTDQKKTDGRWVHSDLEQENIFAHPEK